MEKLTFKETAISINQNPREIQQICLTLLNMAIFVGNQHIPDIDRLLLSVIEDEELVPNLAWLIENSGEVLCGKSLLLVALLCKKSAQWLGKFFLDYKLLSAVDNMAEHLTEKEVYLQQCFTVYLREVAAVIPKLLESVISDVQQLMGEGEGSTSKTNLRLFPVVVNLLENYDFLYKLVNAEMLQQLKTLIKLAESPFQGRGDFYKSVVAFSLISIDPLFIKQNIKMFFEEILPSAFSTCERNRDERMTYFCLKLWFTVVAGLTVKPSSPYKKELEQICFNHFLPLRTRLVEDKDQSSGFAQQIYQLLINYHII